MNKNAATEEFKLKAVQTYLHGGKSLREVAQTLSISYTTLALWVRKYRASGESGLTRKLSRKKRISKDTEHRIMMLKESNPSLSVTKAKQVLTKQGTTISQGAIWHIWKQYGLAGRSINDPLSPLCTMTPQAKRTIEAVQQLLKQGETKAAAKLLNKASCLPPHDILKKIPYRLLSPRRRLDQLHIMFSTMPFPEYRRKVHMLTRTLEKKGYIFSSILAHFYELNALDWMERPKEKMAIFRVLSQKLRRVRSSSLHCLFYLHQAITYCDLLLINQAFSAIKKCRKLVYLLPSQYYLESLASLYTALGNYKEATSLLNRALRKVDDKDAERRLNFKIAATGPTMRGEYRAAQKMLTKVKELKEIPGYSASYTLIQGHVAFGTGNLAEASTCYLESLQKFTKGELLNRLYAASKGLAAIAMALNRHEEARAYLKKYLRLMKKHKVSRDVLVIEQLLALDTVIPKELLNLRTFRILSLLARSQRTLNVSDYRKAFALAQRNGLTGYFHRNIVFFPDIILRLIRMGRSPGLPRALLRLPVFNQQTPVYHVKFLGKVRVTRDQQGVRSRLSPKEKAFLIHLALRADSPGTFIPLQELCENFWPTSVNPLDRLLHLLAALKSKLLIPGHHLSVSSKYGQPRLLNRGVYLTTDYSEFKMLATQAKSLEQADEWSFAERDYRRAFALIRNNPFDKMYDNWSETVRASIHNAIQTEVAHFVRLCRDHNADQHSSRVIQRIRTKIPRINE